MTHLVNSYEGTAWGPGTSEGDKWRRLSDTIAVPLQRLSGCWREREAEEEETARIEQSTEEVTDMLQLW